MNNLSNFQISRRALLGGFTALGAGTLFAPSLLRAATADMTVMNGEVVSGSHFGAFVATVKDGRFVSATPHALDLAPNNMVGALPDLVYSPTRIKYPMVRKGFLEKGYMSDRTERGKGEFVRVSWEQAYDLVAAELIRVKDTYGNSAIYGGSYGWKSSGTLHNAVSGLQRMLNLHGGFVSAVNSYSTGSIRVIMPYVIGGSYYDSSSWVPTIEGTELIVFWGSNPATSNRIAGNVPDHANLAFLEEFRKTGKPSIVIDPLRTKTADVLGSEWIAPRPGTDVAMMLGVAHTLLVEDLHDKKFLADYTVGFDAFSAYLTGAEDGTVKTAEWASEICGVDAETIKGLARTMASKRTLIAQGWSLQRAHHGEQGPWMSHTLACMLGYIGLPGGGADFTLHYSSYGTPVGTGPNIPGFSAGSAFGTVAKVGDPAAEMPAPIPVSRVPWALANAGAQYDYNGKSYTAPDLRLVYWSGGNPFHHHQDRNLHIKYWQSPETIIVQDYNWTQTARFADIVLPATTSYERNDMSQISDKKTGLIAMKKVVEPVFEARNDIDIYAEIAKRLGFEEAYTEGRDEMGWLRFLYEKGLEDAVKKGIAMPDFDTFWNEQNVILYEVSDANRNYVQFADFREDPLLAPLATPSGMFEIFSRKIAGYNYADCPGHPTWMEPYERLGGAMSDKYPLHVLSAHPENRLHSQLDNTTLRHEYEVAGREPIWINPKDAADRGIVDGDVVRVFNDRGQVLAGAIVTDRMSPNVINICEGGWYDPAEPGVIGTLCKHGDVNVLTLDEGTSKLAMGNIAHTALAQAEKYVEAAPAVTTFDPVL